MLITELNTGSNADYLLSLKPGYERKVLFIGTSGPIFLYKGKLLPESRNQTDLFKLKGLRNKLPNVIIKASLAISF